MKPPSPCTGSTMTAAICVRLELVLEALLEKVGARRPAGRVLGG